MPLHELRHPISVPRVGQAIVNGLAGRKGASSIVGERDPCRQLNAAPGGAPRPPPGGGTVPIHYYRAPPGTSGRASPVERDSPSKPGDACPGRTCRPTAKDQERLLSTKARACPPRRVIATPGTAGKGEGAKAFVGRGQRSAFPQTPVFSRLTASSGRAAARQSVLAHDSYGRPTPDRSLAAPPRAIRPPPRGELAPSSTGVPPPRTSIASMGRASGQ